MDSLKWSICCVLLASIGCAGKIEDPSIFEGYEDPSSEPRIEPNRDAGAPAADTGTGPDTSLDASQGSDEPEPTPDAGGGSPSMGSDAGTALNCDFKALMQAKCGNGACHGSPAFSTGLDLVSDGLAERVAGKRGASSCSDYLIIDPDQPEKSSLYLMVTNQSCGVRMPLGGSLTPNEQACILQWIENL